MKFSKISDKIGKIALRAIDVLLILFMLGILGYYGYVDFHFSDEIIGPSLCWILLLPSAGAAINFFLGHFCGDEYYNTGHVSDGWSKYDVIKTPKYYTRRMYFCFIECFLFLLLIIRYSFLFHLNIIIPMLGLICSIIAIIIYFIVGMSSYEKSGIKIKCNIKKDNKTRKKEQHKFKFNKYPELLEKYNQFKIWNSKKFKSYENMNDKKLMSKEIDESFESLACAIFNIFNKIKPDLIIKKTGEKIKWQDIINKPFEELSYKEKLILVRLLDRLYKYVLPDNYYNL